MALLLMPTALLTISSAITGAPGIANEPSKFAPVGTRMIGSAPEGKRAMHLLRVLLTHKEDAHAGRSQGKR